jgi:uncharacterized membrane protein YedE/YeeE
MIELLKGPWPWYVGGPLLGLMVPILLFVGNKHFGVSSSFRHICAAVLPKSRAEYFRYEWKKSLWSLVKVAGIVVGALIAVLFLDGDAGPNLSRDAAEMLASWGIRDISRLQPTQLFAFDAMFHPRSLIMLIGGGFLVGFGTRYGNGCTSGHAIMGLSLLNVGSLVATIGFFAGGMLISNTLLPVILSIGR